MYLIRLKLLFFVLPIGGSLACVVYNETELQTVSTYGYYRDKLYNQRYTNQKWVVKNSTIICANVTSLSEIPYSSEGKDFEQYLTVVNSTILTLPAASLTKFTNITKLFLNGTHVETILPAAFQGFSKLKELHLNDNQLTEVMKGVYNSLSGLEKLDLSNNTIHTIEKFALSGVDNLKELDLTNNNLSSIQVLEGLGKLEVLNLSGNVLKVFRVPNVTTNCLNLSSNALEAVDLSIFTNTQILDLSNNAISSLNGTLKNVSELFLAHNHISALTSPFLATPQTFTVLDFSDNAISKIDKNFFQDVRNLSLLSLAHNQLAEVDGSFFKDMISLRTLNLSRNQIKELQFGVFDRLAKLQILDLSGNKFKQLNQPTLKSLSELRFLYFDDNEISTVDVQDVSTYLMHLEFISLENNPWKCKELSDVYHHFKLRSVQVLEGHTFQEENVYGIACTSEDLSFQPTAETSVEDLLKELVKVVGKTQNISKVERFFNKDFQNSKFFQFFNDTNLSHLFKSLNESRNTVTERILPSQSSNVVEILSLVLQTVIAGSLVVLIYMLQRKEKYYRIKCSELTEY